MAYIGKIVNIVQKMSKMRLAVRTSSPLYLYYQQQTIKIQQDETSMILFNHNILLRMIKENLARAQRLHLSRKFSAKCATAENF